MLLVLKIVCFCCLLAIIIQDFKERSVYLWLLMLTGVLMSLSYYFNTNALLFLINCGLNILVVLVILGILIGYTRLKMRVAFTYAMGLGDVLFFSILAISFPTATFLVLFPCSLLFGLILFLSLKSRLHKKNIPLAGLQALFFLLIFSVNWSFEFINLYAL